MLLLLYVFVSLFSFSKAGNVKFVHSNNDDISECSEENICVRKCCPNGQLMDQVRCAPSNGTDYFDVIMFNGNITIQNGTILKPVTIIHGHDCIEGIGQRLEWYMYDDDIFYIQTDGSLWAPMYDSFKFNMYCLDTFLVPPDESPGPVLTAMFCDVTLKDEKQEKWNAYGMIISMPFLLATFVAYALLPDRNLHMKALMCYVFNLFHAYLFLVTIQLTPEIIGEPWCTIIGYSCIYFFLASFFWMNVICIDIFLGFRGFKGGPGMRSFEYKRFYYYCLYAWGMSFLIVLLTYFCNTQGTVDDWWYPAVSKGQCFVRNGLPQLIFFYGPMGIIILTNIILFSLTAYRIRQVKKDTKMLKHAESKRHSEDDQQKFKLYLKLLLAMGVNWSMEIISWGVNFKEQEIPPYIWYLTDFCNATYGVFIFFIFVFKKNIWKQLKRRYYAFTGRQYLAHSMATTNHTKTTNYSVSTSTNEQRCEENEL